ncbi:hypothetical protein J3D54_005412 [Pseudomonas sp. GGS8]|uniref:hypothetical protein n=1 Tax=Pseudomonas sp. GGS8 TaxID=2817892 RepID=UPI00209EFD44|nr:hypothetical protein [Pseudomonas sp. GGS8]MCP1446280.1 hypothetical protein [Pseudomonas sp. GGS8]
MTTKEGVTFHKFDRGLLAPTIRQAADGFVKPDFLTDCTIHIAVSPSIQVGDSVIPHMDVEGVGGFFRTPLEVTKEDVAEGVIWMLPAYDFTAKSGAAVKVDYTVKKTDGSDLSSPVGNYKVK